MQEWFADYGLPPSGIAFEEALELADTGRVAHLAQRLGLDLTDGVRG
jgi:hypothetical protein